MTFWEFADKHAAGLGTMAVIALFLATLVLIASMGERRGDRGDD